MDHPATSMFPEVFEHYPNAKIVLTVRDNPEVCFTCTLHATAASALDKAIFHCTQHMLRYLMYQHTELADPSMLLRLAPSECMNDTATFEQDAPDHHYHRLALSRVAT